MEDCQHSHCSPAASLSRKIPNGTAKSGYSDVFGGLPRYSGPFPPRPDDYGEIFGGLVDSCSIPVLDLPPAIDDAFEVVPSSSIDYFEIFGGPRPGDLGLSYEDLLPELRNPQSSSSGRRCLNETMTRKQEAAVSDFPMEGPTEDHVLCRDKDQASSSGAAIWPKKDYFSSNGAEHPLNIGTKQKKVSSQGTREDASNGTPHITEIHAVPGFTFAVDTSPPSKVTKHAAPPIQLSNDASVNADCYGAIMENRHFRKVKLPSPSCTGGLGPGNDQKELGIKLTAFEDVPANEHYPSCSSSSSTSSGNRSFCVPSTDEVNLDVDELTVAKLSRKIVPPVSCCNEISGTDFIAHQKQSDMRFKSAEDAPDHDHRHSWSSSNHSMSSGNRFSPDYSTFDLSFDAYSDGGMTEGAHNEKTVSPIPSYVSTRCPTIDLKEDQENLTTLCTTLENSPANARHRSSSSDDHSKSSWGRSCSNNMLLTVSDISLQTEPSHLPPPSRPPPKSGRQGHPKVAMAAKTKPDIGERNANRHVGCHQILHRGGSFETHLHKNSVKDGVLPCFDVEVDASSAAAAIKEAMEQAQARLKSAKESMERKKENLESRKRLGSEEGIQCIKRKENKSTQETHRFNEIAQQTHERKVNQVKVSAQESHNKSTGKAKLASEHEERERHLELFEETLQEMQGKDTRSFKLAYQQDDRCGEWKVEKQFYELIQNEQFKRVQEVLEEVDKKKESTRTTEKGQDREKSAIAAHDLKNVELMAVNEAFEPENGYCKKNGANVASEEVEEISKITLQSYVQEKNKNKHVVLGVCSLEENEKKVVEAQEILDTLQEKNLTASQEACLFKGREKKAKVAKGSSKFEEEEDHGRGEGEKEMHAVNDNCGWEEGKVKFEVVSEEFEMDETGSELKMHLIASGVGMEFKAARRVHEDECLKNLVGSEKGVCSHEKIEAKSAEINVIIENDESKRSNAKEETSEWVENEKELAVIQKHQNWQETTKDISIVEEALVNYVNEKKMEAKTESCQRVSIEKIYRETCDNLQQNEKEQKPDEVECNLDKVDNKLITDREPLVQIDNKNVKEANGPLRENSIFDDAKDVSDRTHDEKKLEHNKVANLSEEQMGTLKIAQKDPRSQDIECMDRKIPEICKKEGRTKAVSIAREREQVIEQVRLLKEEKEREREREKDRVAVERATCEAYERAFTEARERAERVAAEARQRALVDTREKTEKASADTFEKSLVEKASREARLRAERAAVERATTEARERAVERALAEKASQEAREHAARTCVTSVDRQKKNNVVEGHSRTSGNEDGEMGLYTGILDMQDSMHNSGVRNVSFPSSSYQRHSDSSNHASKGKLEGSEGESAIRCKARLERHRRTVERAAKALAEKNLRDALAQKEQVERNRLSETLDADLRRWSNGKEGNLRALLSTLQYILGPESGWQPIPLTDVITAVAVKKAYRKATLYVHPDKLQQKGASIQQKYISEKVFDLLKEAWNRFNSEER